MNLETMQVPLIAYLATIFVMGLVQWYLIYARDRTQIPSVPVGPLPPGPIVHQPGPTPAPSSEPGPSPGPVQPQPVPPGPAPGPDPAPVPIPIPAPTPLPIPAPAGSDFGNCVAVVLKWEGGNDDDPRDPGGRTSRGILQSEWDTWRQTHAGLPPDVWQAPQDQVLAIYKESYWNALYCDSLPPGVDLAVFDYGVNSGISRSAKLLQTIVGSDVDGEVGPDTIAATAKADPVSLVGRFCDARLAFLQGLSTWGTFGNGWTNRVVDVRKNALAMASSGPQPKPTTLPPAANIPASTPPWLTLARSLVGTHAQNDNAVIMAWPRAIAAKFPDPDMASYCARFTHDSIAWCGLFVAYCLAVNGVKPQFGATDIERFLWADAWQKFGTAVDTPQPGDILVFRWPSGGEHVTFYDHEEDDNFYHCIGGNQGTHVVSTEAMAMSSCIAIRRPQ